MPDIVHSDRHRYGNRYIWSELDQRRGTRPRAIEERVTDMVRQCIRAWVMQESDDIVTDPPEIRVQFQLQPENGIGLVHIVCQVGLADTLPNRLY